MSCDDVQQALVGDDATPTMLDHVKTCVECQRFQRLATQRRHLEPQLPTRVRRQAVVVRASLLVALVLAGVVTVALTSTAPPPIATVEPVTAPRPLETQLVVIDEAREWQALTALSHELDAQLHRDVTVSDATYAPFGALPSWVAPSSTLTTFTSPEN